MHQSTRQMEARIERLEKELAALKEGLIAKRRPWYEEIVGSFKNDKEFAEIVRLGQLIRKGKLKA